MANSYNKIRASLLILTLLLIFLFHSCSRTRESSVSKTTFVLNTAATITLYDGSGEELINSCFELCREYEALLSRTLESSEISRLNARETCSVSADTAELLEKGLYYSRLSGGAFDITVEPLSSLWDFSSDEHIVPDAAAVASAAEKVGYENVSLEGDRVFFSSPDTRIDLGAIAKGYIADRMKEYLLSRGVSSAIINLGGNVLCIGEKPGGEGFEVGITYPFESRTIASVTLSDSSVVTSGVYERCFEKDGEFYHHLLDGKTGYPIDNGLLSVTVISPRSTDGDALSTCCFALGLEDGMALINSIEDSYAIFIASDLSLHFSEGLEQAYAIRYS